MLPCILNGKEKDHALIQDKEEKGLLEPFSLMFWILYICCGISDILDGAIARAMHLESEMGANIILFLLCIPIQIK